MAIKGIDIPEEKTPLETWLEIHGAEYAAQIEAWKKKHGAVHLYVTPDGPWAIIRRPSRQEMSYARYSANKDTNTFNEIIARAVWLAGDDVVFNDDKYFYGLTEKIGELIEVVEGELLKL